MEPQKILRKLLTHPKPDPVKFLKQRTWYMTKVECENILQHALGRLPTDNEIKECRPDKMQHLKKDRVWWIDRYGR